MPDSKKPKVLLFDVGGVCVLSPFQAILDYELSQGIPPGWVNYSLSRTSPTGFWHRLETGSIPMDAAFFAGFKSDLHDPSRWADFYASQQARDPSLPRAVPPVPAMDTDFLFHQMMTVSRSPDPWMYPALRALRESGEYILGALSNTVVFPPDHELASGLSEDPVRQVFDFFVSSAHVGLRKPDPRIYELALRTANEFAAENQRGGEGGGIEAGEVLFFDDIGENLKAARNFGFRTFKVPLGRAYEAVDHLEQVTGLALAGAHPKIPIEPRREAAVKAKI
ncbi:related to epoxide hydrolase [Cephalotrichum gorgonifer]|uniref:Related to epoxide hydrolase n=1 Tax=Cephalotrichum gorgonifer TaxID=2041049 RepID=A0AAE8ST15_9PEZI|nr:related to epoxide hydrolase [Cephalotrichum gorgonifer]